MLPPLHYSLMSPGPAGAQGEFFHAAGGSVRVMESLRIEDYVQLAQEVFEDCASVSEARKFDAISVDVFHDGLIGRDNRLSQDAQIRGFTPEELDHLARVL